MAPRRALARIAWSGDGEESMPVIVDAYRDDGGAWLAHLDDPRPQVPAAWLPPGDLDWPG